MQRHAALQKLAIHQVLLRFRASPAAAFPGARYALRFLHLLYYITLFRVSQQNLREKDRRGIPRPALPVIGVFTS